MSLRQESLEELFQFSLRKRRRSQKRMIYGGRRRGSATDIAEKPGLSRNTRSKYFHKGQ